MCNEKRSWFGVIDMSGAGPKTTYSINQSALQWWAWFIGKVIAIIVGLWLGVNWVAGDVFDDALNEFHSVARPQFEQMMDRKIENYTQSFVTIERVHELEKHNERVDEKLKNMERTLALQATTMIDMNRKLDVLIRNGRGGG